ncbi:hypothetical protein AVEN_75487-1 [Araneus ventricosus]|uniref:CCHC-type domain-containing protein n=1 Tax=Araneus ventricosus TaxID=182803 RepID=A0A4Y2DQG4_ARAVE|nr:hypothetical protein AVEN_75487-1 [Araneus ventricosus]
MRSCSTLFASCFSWTANYPHVLAMRGDPLDGWYISVPDVSIGLYPSHLAGLLKGIKRNGHSLGLGVKSCQRFWRCFKCQKFGHSQQACRGASTICAKCSVSGHVSSECISDDIKCINCGGAHPAFSRSCPRWVLEKEILSTKIRKNISFAEARKLITERTPKPGVAYSSAVKQYAYCCYRANADNTQIKNSNLSIISKASVLPANYPQTPKEPSTSTKSAPIVSPNLTIKSPLKQKQTINETNSKHTANVKKPDRITETKAAKRVRLAALKKKKDLCENPISKEDFLKNPQKATTDIQNVVPLLNIHPSDEDLMSSVSETDSPPPSPKNS